MYQFTSKKDLENKVNNFTDWQKKPSPTNEKLETQIRQQLTAVLSTVEKGTNPGEAFVELSAKAMVNNLLQVWEIKER